MTGPAKRPRKLPDMMLEAIHDAKKHESIPYHVSARDLGLNRDELGRQLKAWRKKNGC